MTPAIDIIKAAKVFYQIHEYAHDASVGSYGDEAAEKLGIDASRVFKTLVVKLGDQRLVVGIVPVNAQLSMKLIAKAASAKKANMADQTMVERSTGYVFGGVSPIGQKKFLASYIDVSAQDMETIFVSAGRRGLEIELKPSDFLTLTRGVFVKLSQS